VKVHEEETFVSKYPGIRVLKDYSKDPDPSFWSSFPKADLPHEIGSKVNKDKLKFLIEKYKSEWTEPKKKRADRLYKDLSEGGGAYQETDLPPATFPNAKSSFMHGQMLTEKIASFIEEGFVKGPFVAAPLRGFRANTLMAVHRNGKVRPVINMSGPAGGSFNENILSHKLEKVKMATAKEFSYEVIEAGKGAIMSKFDLKDAFKLIPARKDDWKLQGFKWLGSFFVETQMIFGAVPSVSNFDRLGSVVVELAKSKAGTPSKKVCRTLDDITIVSPKDSGITEIFSQALKEVCEFASVPLADPCPLKEKAFINETRGIILGIGFDTDRAEWYLSEEKAEKHSSRILSAAQKKYIDLKETQKVMGVINDLTQLCPFAKIFQATGNRFLAGFEANENILKNVEELVAQDWLICVRIIKSAIKGIPIPRRPGMQSLGCLVFTSDAAGSKFDSLKGERFFHNIPGDRGVACVLSEEKEIKWYCRTPWSKNLLETSRDKRGKYYGSKTTTLEAVGLLLPFLSIPEALAGKDIVFRTDNIAVVFGWESKSVKFDRTASIMIKAVVLLASFLGCRVFVEHLPRMSSMEASIADHLSRLSSMEDEDWVMIEEAAVGSLEGALREWIEDPTEDERLPFVLLDELKFRMSP